MRKVIYFFQVILLLFLLPNCQHGKKIGGTGRKAGTTAEKQYPIAILPAPINSPVKNTPYAKVTEYNVDYYTIKDCKGKWIYAYREKNGQIFQGWLEPTMQCPNPYTTCN